MIGTRPNEIAIASGTPSGAFHLDDLISEVIELERGSPPRSSAALPPHVPATQIGGLPTRSIASPIRLALGVAALLGLVTTGLVALLHW